MEYFKQFQTHIANNSLPSVVNLWQEYCLSEEVDPEEFKQILIHIKGSTLVESFGCYVEQGLLLWENLPESNLKHAILKEIFDIQTTNEKNLADLAYSYLEERYKDDPGFQQKIKLVGLREKTNFQNAISNFELLVHMKKGNFFIHTGGWGVGEVIDVSMLREQITLEFDFVAGHKEISFANAFKTLIPIPKTHFLARRFGDPEAFEAYAKQHPVETIRILLSDLGPKSALEIKDELCDLVIPEDEWARWWQTTRTKLKKDTFIETPANLKDSFTLRKTEVSHEERLQKALEKSPDANTLIEMIYTFMRDFPGALKNDEFKKFLLNQLMEVLSHKEITDSQEIQILFILQDLGHEKAKDMSALISKLTKIENIVDGIHVIAYKKRFVNELKNHKSEWPKDFADLLFTVDQATLRDFLLDELLASGNKQMITTKFDDILDNPKSAPEAFLWYFQKIMGNDKYPFANQEGMDRFFESFLVLLHTIETDTNYRDLVKKMLHFLTSGRFANVRRILQGSSLEVTQEILLLCTKCQTLTDHDIKIMHSLAEVVHPSLSTLRKSHLNEAEEESHIWTTAEGYQKVKDRIEQIATVETVENAKEIEIARSHGDLRENSEYKFAQERRARLQSELRFLSNQIKHMRILTQEDINTDKVGVGCVVDLQNEKGDRTSYTFLGAWDAEPEKNILSNQSKLAKDLTGLRVGNTCSIKNQEWKITAIRSYL